MTKNSHYTLVSHYGVAVLLEDEKGNQQTHRVGRNSGFVVGDQVLIKNSRLEIIERKNQLQRKTPFAKQHIMAANIDALGIVVSPFPLVPPSFIDSAILAAFYDGIDPFIVVNKIDMPESKAYLEALQKTYGEEINIIGISAKNRLNIDALASFIAQKGRVIFVGVSGAGKSSLTNALAPQATQSIAVHEDDKRHGKHTTSASVLLRLPRGGELIDSPGVRDFKPVACEPTYIAKHFVGFAPFLKEPCKFRSCLHIKEPGCRILEALEKGLFPQERLDLYHALIA